MVLRRVEVNGDSGIVAARCLALTCGEAAR